MTTPIPVFTETPTAEIRWLDVGGMKPLLQQKWLIAEVGSKAAPREEWRLVATVVEKRK